MHNQSSCVATASTTTWLSSRFMMLFSTGGEPSLPVCGGGKSTLLSFLVLRERWAARICWPAETRWRSSRPPSPTLLEMMDYGTGSLPLLPPWTILFLHMYNTGLLATPATPSLSITQVVSQRQQSSSSPFLLLRRCQKKENFVCSNLKILALFVWDNQYNASMSRPVFLHTQTRASHKTKARPAPSVRWWKLFRRVKMSSIYDPSGGL